MNSSAPPTATPATTSAELLAKKGIDEKEMVRYGERFFTSLGFEPLPETFWDRSLFTKPEGSRRRLPRQRLGHRLGRRHAHQDVHRAQRRGLRHHPPRAGAQLLPAGLQEPVFPPTRAPTTASTRASATPIALSITPEYLRKIGLLDRAPPPGRRPRPVDDAWRWTRSPSCRSACWWISGAGRCSAARSPPRTTTTAGGDCAQKYQGDPSAGDPHRIGLRSRRQIPHPGATLPTPVTSWRTSCSSRSTARCARRRATKDRYTTARSTKATRPANGCATCSRWVPADPGPTHWRRLPVSGRWTPPRSSITSLR